MTPSYSRNIIHKGAPDQERKVREVETQPFQPDAAPDESETVHHAIHIHRDGVPADPEPVADAPDHRPDVPSSAGEAEDENPTTEATDTPPAEPEPSPLDQAREEAERLLEQAHRQAEQIAEEAYREGFDQGEKAGLELGQQKVEPMIKSLDSIAQGLLHTQAQLVEHLEGELIKVAFAIATRLLHKELSLSPETVVNVAREAIKRTVTGGRIMLRVHPLDMEYLQKSGSILPEFASHSEDLTLKPDYEVLRGGVIVETESGQIDTTLDTQLTILWNALAGQDDVAQPQEDHRLPDDEGPETASAAGGAS